MINSKAVCDQKANQCVFHRRACTSHRPQQVATASWSLPDHPTLTFQLCAAWVPGIHTAPLVEEKQRTNKDRLANVDWRGKVTMC